MARRRAWPIATTAEHSPTAQIDPLGAVATTDSASAWSDACPPKQSMAGGRASEYARSRLWIIPLAALVLAGGLAGIALYADAHWVPKPWSGNVRRTPLHGRASAPVSKRAKDGSRKTVNPIGASTRLRKTLRAV